jgi:hypothetical protein
MGFCFYRDVFGDWRWEHFADDGQVRDSRYSYRSREECVDAADTASLAFRRVAEPASGARYSLIARSQHRAAGMQKNRDGGLE